MDKITHEVCCEQWTRIINECLASGMNKTVWCKANGISDKSFFYWQRILRNEAYISHNQLPETAVSNKETPVAFVEWKPTKNTADRQEGFQPDIIIRKKDLVLEISNTALVGLLGGFIHAE